MKNEVFHLGITRSDLARAEIALLPGDPARVPKIAGKLEGARELKFNREYRSFLGTLQGRPVLVMSTGIGGPSAAIAVEELAQLGVKQFMRIGTTGAIQPGIGRGDVIITTAAVRLDGASYHLAPPEYPAVADFAMTANLIRAAREEGIPSHVGISASSDTFYQGQCRNDSFKKDFIIEKWRNSMKEWQNLNVLAYEMEAATILTQTSTYGLKGACVCGVLVNRTKTEMPDHAIAGQVEANVIAVAIRSLTYPLPF